MASGAWTATARSAGGSFVADVATRLRLALVADYVVLGGGNARLMKELPEQTRLGKNTNAFIGGFRLWEEKYPPMLDAGASSLPPGDGHDGGMSK